MVQKVHDPWDSQFQLIKCILRYIEGTSLLSLQMHKSSLLDLIAYSHADWSGCPNTHKSTSGYYVSLGKNLISWSSRRQHTVSRSSTEVEYRIVVSCVVEYSWLQQLLHELPHPPSHATMVYCDNVTPCTCQIRFSVREPNMLRLIFTSS